VSLLYLGEYLWGVDHPPNIITDRTQLLAVDPMQSVDPSTGF
jgi:hypothetical protein